MASSPMAIDGAINRTQEIYDPLPGTTCDHLACCCRAGCPNMYFAEFMGIYNKFVASLPKDEHIDLTLQCLRMYLQPQSVDRPKPCVFLKEDKCSVYDARPLKCRLYGLYPKSLYERMVEGVAQDMATEKEKIPLCVQCDRVKVKPEHAKQYPLGKIPEGTIKSMEMALKANDAALGVPAKIQNDGFGYLTYHDWHVMYEFGEKFMELLTKVRLHWQEDKKELLIQDVKKLLTDAPAAGEKDGK